MSKLKAEDREKRDQVTRLIIDGWNAGLTGGELSVVHNLTRNAIMAILHRARIGGAMVQARNRHSAAATAARVKKAQERKRPEPSLSAITIQRPSLLAKTRQFPKPKPIIIAPEVLALPADGLWVGFMDLQNNAGCRYSEDAKLFCNRPGFPYCPDHKAIVNPPSAQRGSSKTLAKNYGGWR